MKDEPLLYVYAVVRSPGTVDPLFGATLGTGLAAVDHRGLTALVEPVPAAEFEEAPLRARLEDLDWLARVARAHHGVVAEAGRHSTVVPLRLATVCRGEPGVRRLLEEGEHSLSEALDRLTGAHEWGVKLYVDEPAARPVPEHAGSGTAQGGSGRDYLRRRLGEQRARQDADDAAARTARHLHEALARTAADAVLHPPQQATLSRAPGRNVLNAAYLVPDESRRKFLDTLPPSEDVHNGLRVVLTGPWVPYSFTRTAPGEETDR
ncbi:GvpL/GvpF family gas vesicle protein [Streptomyces purpureus]|uniref:Gas vesicle protein n=1 Tax=Streptomyces purpureus TaxID=1951 RepID=A0A918LLC6_9ACTN|nr:GvpL/GvpF family gas vesicle protein [Streptomyces purpureus]GGT16194.1 gas vesicle protein [Streptomyces purpureus]